MLIERKQINYPSLRNTRFLAFSSSLKANAEEERIVFLIDLILAVSSCFICNALSFCSTSVDFATSCLSKRLSKASILRMAFLYEPL